MIKYHQMNLLSWLSWFFSLNKLLINDSWKMNRPWYDPRSLCYHKCSLHAMRSWSVSNVSLFQLLTKFISLDSRYCLLHVRRYLHVPTLLTRSVNTVMCYCYHSEKRPIDLGDKLLQHMLWYTKRRSIG